MPLCELFKGEGGTSIPELFNEDFCDLALFFFTDGVFLFTYFDLIWCFVIPTEPAWQACEGEGKGKTQAHEVREGRGRLQGCYCFLHSAPN